MDALRGRAPYVFARRCAACLLAFGSVVIYMYCVVFQCAQQALYDVSRRTEYILLMEVRVRNEPRVRECSVGSVSL